MMMTTTMTTTTTRIWMGGEGRGGGREKDDGMTTIICSMGNIRAYLPAMMTGGTTTRTFPSSWHWILVRRPTTFLLLPYHCPPSCCCCHHCRGQQQRWQVDTEIKDLWPFPLQMTTMALNKNIDNGNVMTRIQVMVRLPSLSPPMLDARGIIIMTWIAMTTTIHTTGGAQIVGETTRVLW
jgi:hypothetical protein